jgi:hypothetical protein
MCDYSLMGVPNRLAREGEQLVLHRFPAGSLGLASPADLQPRVNADRSPRTFWSAVKEFFAAPYQPTVCAVCIPPGTLLILRDISPKLRQSMGVSAEESVTFTQISANPYQYRDAVRFPSGREVRLQDLQEGQRLQVLQMTSTEESEIPLELPAMQPAVQAGQRDQRF